jgi:hypothetical protein
MSEDVTISEEIKSEKMRQFWFTLYTQDIELAQRFVEIQTGKEQTLTEKERQRCYQKLYEIIIEAYQLKEDPVTKASRSYLKLLQDYYDCTHSVPNGSRQVIVTMKNDNENSSKNYEDEAYEKILQALQRAEINSLICEAFKIALKQYLENSKHTIDELISSLPKEIVTYVFEIYLNIKTPKKVKKNHANMGLGGYEGFALGLMVWALEAFLAINPYQAYGDENKRSGCYIANEVFISNKYGKTSYNTFKTAYNKFQKYYTTKLPKGFILKNYPQHS